jgi:hypothetical protein
VTRRAGQRAMIRTNVVIIATTLNTIRYSIFYIISSGVVHVELRLSLAH